jgi:hypothetical protein
MKNLTQAQARGSWTGAAIGQWDNEGGTTEQTHTVAGSELNYEQSPNIMSHFDIKDFDSLDQSGGYRGADAGAEYQDCAGGAECRV